MTAPQSMKILKASAGLDQGNVLAGLLGDGFEIREYDPRRALADQVADIEAMLLRDVPVDRTVIDAAPQLRLLQRYGSHIHDVDISYARARGIHVARVPPDATGSNRQVAEHALFLMLAVAKRYRLCQEALAARRVGWPKTFALTGRTLGLVGVGATGRELARLARGMDMRVIAIKRTPDPGLREALGLDWLCGMPALPKLLGESDFVSIHLPLDETTRGFFNDRLFSLMKRGSILINIARGPIVEYDALMAALDGGILAGAGLDVFWEEPIAPDDRLLADSRVVATPHMAAQSFESQYKLAEVVANNILRVRDQLVPLYAVEADGTDG